MLTVIVFFLLEFWLRTFVSYWCNLHHCGSL